MNSLKTKYRNDAKKAQEAWEQQQKEEALRIANMTPEERQQYNKEKAARRRAAMQWLGITSAVASTLSDKPYR